MRNQGYTLAAAAAGSWLPLNVKQTPFSVSVAVLFNSAASGITYTVQHTFSPLDTRQKANISRAGTTVTVTTKDHHGLSTNDSVIIQNANTLTGAVGLDGTYTVTVSSATVFTYTSGTNGTVTYGLYDAEITPLVVFNHADLVNKTAAADGNYAFPCMATRLNVSAYTAGDVTFRVIQGQA